MIELTITCKSCNREFEPDHDDVVRGRWHVCADCRPRPKDPPRRRPLADHHNLPARQRPRDPDDQRPSGLVKECTT